MHRRRGFTLVELLVAMALTIFIMLILTQAFILSIDAFVGMKAIGDLQENLRAGANQLRFDLAQDHLDGKRRLSDPSVGGGPSAFFTPGLVSQLPRSGFLAVYQAVPGGLPGSVPSTLEGLDLDLMPSFQSANNILHFTSRLRGNQLQSFYTANITNPVNPANTNFFNWRTIPGMDPQIPLQFGVDADATLRPNYTTVLPNVPNGPLIYRGQWAEVVYFPGSINGPLVPTGTTEEPLNPNGTTGMKLYGLYRAQYVAVPDNSVVNNAGYPAAAVANFPGMACIGNPATGALNFFSPDDMASGQLWSAGAPGGSLWTLTPTGAPSGGSFQIICGAQTPNLVTTAPIPYNATRAVVQAALASVNVAGLVTGGPANVSTMTILLAAPTATQPAAGPIGVLNNLQGAFMPAITPAINAAAVRTFNLASPQLAGAALVVPNILSFQVQVIRTGSTAPQDAWYDSAVFGTPPLLGLAITIRVWDVKTRQTRQLTIYQDL